MRKRLYCLSVSLFYLLAAAAASLVASSPVQSAWNTTVTPANSAVYNPGEMGVKFQVSEAGQIQGIRFYKGTGNTGTHIGNLWDDAGNLLASITFTNETGAGWQTAYFSEPVYIQPNTTYVASYYSPSGGYSYDANYFTNPYTNGAITLLSSAQAGGNGVYTWGSASAFPTQTYQAFNYWVDILFAAQPDESGWNGTGTPASSAVYNPGEMGVKFQVSQAGQIQGISFYKGSGNTGVHTGHLWDASGHLLASVTFTNETATGWQTAYFAPLSVQPGATYVASYYSPNGGYSYTANYFNSSYTKGM